MQLTTTPTTFTERFCAIYDLEHPYRDPGARVRPAEVFEYIDAFSVDKPPPHPTSAIEWDLIRTFGESDGRRMLLRASRRWDAKPIRARDIVYKWWDDDYVPRAWVDEYLAEVIDTWRLDQKQLRERALREAERAQVEARIERSRERARALERACEEGWLPHAGKQWPDPEVMVWCGLHGRWFDPIDQVEAAIEYFENKHAQYETFAEGIRTGRIPKPSAPEDMLPPTPHKGFGGYTMPLRGKFRRKFDS
jgi:hypothetical protein